MGVVTIVGFAFLMRVLDGVGVGLHLTLSELWVETGDIHLRLQSGNEGSFHLLAEDSLPVDLLEPGVLLYLLCTLGS